MTRSPDVRHEKETHLGRRDLMKLLGIGALAPSSLLGDGRATASPDSGKAASRPALPMGTGVPQRYYVSAAAATSGVGTAASPFKTISEAAAVAQAGDTVIVHAGTYRETVNPLRGGTSDRARITYQAAPNEVAVITGSDQV